MKKLFASLAITALVALPVAVIFTAVLRPPDAIPAIFVAVSVVIIVFAIQKKKLILGKKI